MMHQEYELEKWVWTEEDFERMGWHDSRIYALAFSPETFELLLDIDYIFQWINPEPGETFYKFWVAPATLIFENVSDVDFDIGSYNSGLEIINIRRDEARKPRNAEHIQRQTEWQWTLDCQQGDIKLWSVGYKQYIRSAPRSDMGQKLGLTARGRYSFARGAADGF